MNSFTFWSISASVECGWMPNADPRPLSTTPDGDVDGPRQEVIRARQHALAGIPAGRDSRSSCRGSRAR